MACLAILNASVPRIYVACLASYNAGTLHGRWIDCDQDADSIQEEVSAMLKESQEPNAEEWAIHDYDNFGSFRPGEWESFTTCARVAELMTEHGDTFDAAYALGSDLEEAEDLLERFAGSARSLEDWAEDWAVECGLIDDSHPMFCFVDFEKYARDLQYAGDISSVVIGGTVSVFNN